MDLNKLTTGEKLIAGSGLALFIFSFFPWFGAGDIIKHTAWSNFLSFIAVLLGVAMAAQVLISKFTTAKLPTPPVPWGRVHLILGVAALALVLLQALIGDTVTVLGISGDLDRKFGLFLGIVAAGGLAYGGFVRSKEPEVTPGFRP